MTTINKTKYKIPYYTWLALIVTSSLGSYLKLGSISLYKIILFLHLFLFFYNFDRFSSFKNFLLNNRNYLWLFLWFFCSFTSMFHEQINLSDSLNYLYFTFEGLNFLIFSSFYLKKIGTKDIFFIITFLFIISLIIGCIESLTGEHLSNSGSLYYNPSTSNYQPTGFLFNTNNYAVYITSYFPIVFYCINQSKLFFNKLLSFFITSITIFIIITTCSRGSMLALLFILIYIYISYLKKYTPFLLVLIFGSLLLASITNTLENNMLINKVIKSFTEKNESTNQRIDIYMNTISIFKSHIIRGVGIGNVEKVLAYMKTGYFSKSINMTLVSKPHNFFLEQMASLGLMSLSFIIFIFNILSKNIRSLKRYKNKQKLMFLCWLPFLSFFIGCLIMSSSIDQRFNWILLGIISYFSDGG